MSLEDRVNKDISEYKTFEQSYVQHLGRLLQKFTTQTTTLAHVVFEECRNTELYDPDKNCTDICELEVDNITETLDNIKEVLSQVHFMRQTIHNYTYILTASDEEYNIR